MYTHSFRLISLLVLLTPLLPGQVPVVDLFYRLAGGTNTSVSPNGTIPFGGVSVGTPATATLLLVNRETNGTVYTISGVNVAAGAFSAGAPSVSSIGPGETALIALKFTPDKAGIADAMLTLQLTRATGGQSQAIYLFLTGSGTSPQFVVTYILTQGGNEISLDQSPILNFSPTVVTQSTTAIVIIANKGTGSGTVQRVALAGKTFQLSGLPLLPYDILPNTDLRFTITFTPTVIGDVQGTLSLTMGNVSRDVVLKGTGTGPQLSASYISENGSTALADGDAVPFPDTPTGKSSSITIQLANTGNGVARIGAISTNGAAFQLGDRPPLPYSLAAGSTVRFSIVFSPQDVGEGSGRLFVDAMSFELKGTGKGAKLAYTYTVDGTPRTVAPSGVILFPNTSAGSKSTLQFQVQNQGNLTASLQRISVTGTGFSALSAPAGPNSIQPGDQISFAIDFSPQTLGTINGSLQIDDQSFTLRGTGNPPATQPSATLTGLTANLSALAQPAIGVTLTDPYPLDLTGKLKISFNSGSFADDPTIQFASGGRSIDFRVPANSREAVFGDSSKTALFQTGSVAGVISIQASFSVAGVDVTPSAPPSATITIGMSAPQLRSIQAGTRSSNSVQLLISGYTTARSVKQLSFSFTPAPGYTLQGDSVTVDVDAAFSGWYQTPGSAAYGSQFTATVTVTAANISAIQSVAVSAANTYGSSSAVSTQLNP